MRKEHASSVLVLPRLVALGAVCEALACQPGREPGSLCPGRTRTLLAYTGLCGVTNEVLLWRFQGVFVTLV